MEQLTTEQRTYDWYKARFGMFTASEVHKLMGKTDMNKSKNGEVVFGDTAMSYIYRIASERKLLYNGIWDSMTDEEKDDFIRTQYASNKAMQWGTEHEDMARNRFAFETSKIITEVGSCVNTNLLCLSASPDGVIENEDALVEIKCPSLETYARYSDRIHDNLSLLEEKPEYYWQIQTQLWVTEKKLCYFVWYHPYVGLQYTTIVPDTNNTNMMLNRIEEAEELAQRIYQKL